MSEVSSAQPPASPVSKDTRTFKEKYIDLEFNWELLMSVSLEFVASITFIFGIMQLPYLGLGSAVSGLIIAFIAIVTIYAFGPRCGAPFNPCIVVGLMFGGKINLIKGLLYIVVEFVGGLLAGAFFLAVYPNLPDGTDRGSLLVISPGSGVSNVSAIFMEMIAAFILVLIVFRVAAGVREPAYEKGMTAEEIKNTKNKRRQVYFKQMIAFPWAIGAALGFLSYASGYLSGGAYNPARALGGCVAGSDCSDIWIYFIGDFVGGALAGLFHYWFFELPHGDSMHEITNEYEANGDL